MVQIETDANISQEDSNDVNRLSETMSKTSCKSWAAGPILHSLFNHCIAPDRLVHVLRSNVPIFGTNRPENLGTLGAFEPLLVAGHIGCQPLLAGKLFPTGGAGKLVPVDLGVELEVALAVGFIITLSTFELWSV